LALVLAATSGCAAPGYGPDDAGVLPRWRSVLDGHGALRFGTLAEGALPQSVSPEHTLVLVDRNGRPPEQRLDERSAQTLRAFVAQGGRLVLFGHAARLVHELGFERERPECTSYRWGFDRRALQGKADVGVVVVSGEEPALFEGLTASGVDERFDLTGGAPCDVPLCAWQVGEPQDGFVLARVGSERDGHAQPVGAPVVVRWRVGDGQVLACGLLPAIGHEQEAIRANAAAFVRRCAEFGGARAGALMVFELPERAAEPVATLDGPLPAIVPHLAHWGWQVGLYDGDERDAVRPHRELLHDALLPSWMGGADVVELELTDAQHGSPLQIGDRDPVEVPLSWRGNPMDASAVSSGFGTLADEVHTRGMLLFGGLDPLPVGDRAAERLVALRLHARQLAGVRRLGSAAFDGFGLRQWWPDRRGFGVAMVQDYQPAATLYCAGERTPRLAGALRALDADDGAVRGAPFAGVTDTWRDGFAGDAFPVGVLDARANGDRYPGAGVRGGGSHGDWLAAQMNTFVRERIGRGGCVLWRRHDPRTLGPFGVDYVHGLGLEPLRAAVATPLAATGVDGVRAGAAALIDGAPTGFGADVAAPAAVHVLQNNWFRLLGSGGALRFDPRGLARYGEPARSISPGFLHTRLFGGRPDVDALHAERRDLLQGGHRGAGGYGETVRLEHGRRVAGRVPALLAFDQAPEWPRAVEFEWRPTPGYHELLLQLRGERGDSLVAVTLDDVLLRCLPVREQAGGELVRVPVHVAERSPRVLRVEVLDGSAVAIDRAELHREGDVGVEASVRVAAGSVAQLVEHSWSSYHEEEVTLTTMADLPGFVVQTRCRNAVRNLQVERTLALPGYDRVSRGSDGDDPDQRRRPFVLQNSDASLPDLVVVPLKLARYEHLRVAGGGLQWRAAPEPGVTARVGFLLCEHGDGPALLAHATRQLAGLVEPLGVDLGADGKASIASDHERPWNRLLHVLGDVRTPFLVCEQGVWSWRGSQPAPGGGAWLRVVQQPGDVVEVVGGPVVLARTRPGPGSLRVVAMQDPMPRSVTALVLQPSRLRAPSVVMGADFDEVTVDGEPWSWFDGRTVFLPDAVGRYRIETKQRGGAVASPSLACTGAPLTRCAFDAQRRELVLVTAGRRDRPFELPWTAVLRGPRPTSIENGELVDVHELHLPDEVAERAAEQGGVLIRFRNGVTTVRYGDGPQ